MILIVPHEQSPHVFTDQKTANPVMLKMVGTQFLLLKMLVCI